MSIVNFVRRDLPIRSRWSAGDRRGPRCRGLFLAFGQGHTGAARRPVGRSTSWLPGSAGCTAGAVQHGPALL